MNPHRVPADATTRRTRLTTEARLDRGAAATGEDDVDGPWRHGDTAYDQGGAVAAESGAGGVRS